MALPVVEKPGVPAYMVSFGDMITLLLTFFILLVAMADSRQYGLVGAGQGPVIKHLMAEGKPGILKGRLIEKRQRHKRDLWWIPDQVGTPDELEQVKEKLDRELQVRFKSHEARIDYENDTVVLRLPARLELGADGVSRLAPGVQEILAEVAEEVRLVPTRTVRIHADVPPTGRLDLELLESGYQARSIYDHLANKGVPVQRMGIWGWGASRAIANGPTLQANRGVSIEILDLPARTP